MPPAPRHGRGLARRLARQFREAALRATPAEAVDLDRLHALVTTGAIAVPEASRRLTDLMRAQRERTTER